MHCAQVILLGVFYRCYEHAVLTSSSVARQNRFERGEAREEMTF